MLGRFILLGSGMFVWQAVRFRFCVLCINFSSSNRRVPLVHYCDPPLWVRCLLLLCSHALLFPIPAFFSFLSRGSRKKFMYASNNARIFRTLFTELPKRDIWFNFTWGSERMRERVVFQSINWRPWAFKINVFWLLFRPVKKLAWLMSASNRLK